MIRTQHNTLGVLGIEPLALLRYILIRLFTTPHDRSMIADSILYTLIRAIRCATLFTLYTPATLKDEILRRVTPVRMHLQIYLIVTFVGVLLAAVMLTYMERQMAPLIIHSEIFPFWSIIFFFDQNNTHAVRQ